MTGSNPVDQGSNPWGRACERTFTRQMGSSSNRKMPVSQAGDPGAIPGGSTSQHSPVAKRLRQLPYKETNGGSSPSRTTDYAQIRQPAERLGSDPRVCRFDSCSGYLKNTSSWSSGVLACLSRRRSWVQIPSGTLNMAWYANWQSDGFQTSVFVGSTPTRATRKNMRRLGIGEPNCL